jgi:glycosyltransferase involved in cell wall biosynthesis
VPYPPNDGGRIGFFNPIKFLSKTHDVTIVTLMTDGEAVALEGLKKFCPDVRVFRRPSRGNWNRLLRSAISYPPGSAGKYWHVAAGEVIREAIATHSPDIVEFHHLNTAAYRRFAGLVPSVLREHNVEFKVWERHAVNTTNWAEKIYAKWTAPRVRRYEGEVAAEFDRCIVVSEADAAHLQKVAPSARIEVIPSGVDTEYFVPNPSVEEEPWSLTLTGSFEWKPKQQSLRSLLTRVFPIIRAKVPKARLHVVGRGVPKDLRRFAEETPGVSIHGPVADVRPYIARSALMIQYLESGGGIALKVLEAMAMRKPVLSNSLGCEGIPLKHGADFYLANGAEEFAEAAAMLLADRAFRLRLAQGGFHKVIERYSWNVIANCFQECYRSVLEDRGAGCPRGEAERVHFAS